jgi:hypothetical protein
VLKGGALPVLEHSKVCTLCDFGHLQFFVIYFPKTTVVFV